MEAENSEPDSTRGRLLADVPPAATSPRMPAKRRPLLWALSSSAGFLMASASTIAILLVAALSFGCYVVSALLGKVRPLRAGCEFLSRSYDRLLDRLGRHVLQDSRDTPALRLMVSLSLTALPIFLIQILIGEAQLLLAAAFYLSLYGLEFRRFVRMFSAKHVEAHRPSGYFAQGYNKIFGRYVEFFLGYLYGNVPELDRTFHVRLHHKENNGPADTASSRTYDRTSRLDFLRYLSNHLWTTLGVAPYAYFEARGQDKNRSRMKWGMVRYFSFAGAVFVYDWGIGVLFVMVPFLCMNFITGIIAWVQHAFYDPENPDDYFAHTVTVLDEVNFMNEGYHLCHHDRAGLHWSELPSHFEQLRGKMRASGSFVFRDLDFMGLFFEMTLLRRMDVLADKLLPWEPMSHAERLALIARRTKPV